MIYHYQVFIGARPMAMGETFVAVADDINAIYWKPAGLPALNQLGVNRMHANLTSEKAHLAEQEERDGKIYIVYYMKIYNYIDSRIEQVVAFRDQPNSQQIFHRPLFALFRMGFDTGLVLDGLEEPTFPNDLPVVKNQVSWNSNYCKIPPVLVARMRFQANDC